MKRLVVPVAAAVATAAIVVSAGQLRLAASEPDAPIAIRSLPISPLDQVPGFGKSSKAMLRDDAIALWEAFRREVMTRGCMRNAGYNYDILDMASKSERIKIANLLEVDATTIEEPAASSNPDSRTDGYWRALHDISLEEASTGRQEGEPGGCVEASWDALPGIWEAKKILSEQQADMFLDVDKSLAGAKLEFSACAANLGMKDVERPEAVLDLAASDRSTDARLVDQVLEDCSPAFEAEHAQMLFNYEKAFVEENASILAKQDSYVNALDEIRSDAGFVTYLQLGTFGP